MKAALFLSILILMGCDKKTTTYDRNKLKIDYSGIDGIIIGGDWVEIKEKLNMSFFVQDYKDISYIEECYGAKNVTVNDMGVNFDVNKNNIVTAIYTSNPNVISLDNIKVGSGENELLKIDSIKKFEKNNVGEDNDIYFEYLTPISSYDTYFIYQTDHHKKVDLIGLYSKGHLSCYE